MNPKEFDQASVFAEIAKIRERMLRRESLKSLNGGPREQLSEEERMLELIFENPSAIARSETTIGQEQLKPLLKKVEDMRGWVLGSGQPGQFDPESKELEKGPFLATVSPMEVEVEEDDDETKPKLGLTVNDPNFHFNVYFGFEDYFSLMIYFDDVEPSGMSYEACGSLLEMTDVEYRIINYYIDEFAEQVIQNPRDN